MALPGLILSDMILFARKLTRDTSTTNPGLADADYTDLINEQYLTWWTRFRDREEYVQQLGYVTDRTATIASPAGYREITSLEAYPVTTGGTPSQPVPLERMESHDARRRAQERGFQSDTQLAGAAWVRNTTDDKFTIMPYPYLDLQGATRSTASAIITYASGSATLTAANLTAFDNFMVGAVFTTNAELAASIVIAKGVNSAGTLATLTVDVAPTLQTLTPGLCTATNRAMVSGWVRKYPAVLTSNDRPDTGAVESRWIARLAAAQGAQLLGRDQDEVATILQPLPSDFMISMAPARRNVGPLSKSEEPQVG